MPEKTETTTNQQTQPHAGQEAVSNVAEKSDQAEASQQKVQSPWEQQFEGKTPQQVAEEIDHWRKHSREWESRAKASKKELDTMEAKQPDLASANQRAQEAEQQLTQSQSEVAMFRDLIALEVESGAPVPIAALADSIAFRDAYRALDREADDFADKLQQIVERRYRSAGSQRTFEVNGLQQQSSGNALYEQLFNK